MASGLWSSKELSLNRWGTLLFAQKMTFGQSLMVTEGALKLEYASVIFVDPGIPIDET